MDRIELLEAIRAAFVDTLRPSDGDMFVCDSEGAVDAFVGKTWQQLDDVKIDYHSAALGYFSATAFVYFLPAFMSAGIRNPNLGVSDQVIWRLTPPKMDVLRQSYFNRWKLFSSPQRAVIVEFVRHLETRGRLHHTDLSTILNDAVAL